MTRYWSEWLPNMPADCAYHLSSYGDRLRGNKAVLLRACRDAGVSVSLQALLMGMAMVETTSLSAADRDASKDGCTDGSANVSLFNLSVDLVTQLGYSGDASWLNTRDGLARAVGLLAEGVRRWGVVRLLNFVRGGRRGFEDGVSYDCYGYRNTIATMLRVIDAQPAVMWDDRRVEIDLAHV